MHKLLILSRHADEYHRLIHTARLPELEVRSTSDPATAVELGADCDVVLGEPSLIRGVLPQVRALRWVQATWAGVEPSSSRRFAAITS